MQVPFLTLDRPMNLRAASFRSTYQEVCQDIFAVFRDKWLGANFALDRPVDYLRSCVDAHDLVTCSALRTLKFFRPILGHSRAILPARPNSKAQ